LLFKPAVAVLHKERSAQDNLRLRIDTAHLAIINRNQEKTNQWSSFQQEFAARIPHVEQEEFFVFRNLSPELCVNLSDNEQIKKVEDELTQSITKRVAHVEL